MNNLLKQNLSIESNDVLVYRKISNNNMSLDMENKNLEIEPYQLQAALSKYQKLQNWSLSNVKKYLIEKKIYSANEIDEMEREYKRFLSIATVSNLPIPISEVVDPFWHTHMLFTKDYISMSNHINGSYIHHNPATEDELVELKTPFLNYTLSFYEQVFGKPNPKYWNTQCCKACTCSS